MSNSDKKADIITFKEICDNIAKYCAQGKDELQLPPHPPMSMAQTNQEYLNREMTQRLDILELENDSLKKRVEVIRIEAIAWTDANEVSIGKERIRAEIDVARSAATLRKELRDSVSKSQRAARGDIS